MPTEEQSNPTIKAINAYNPSEGKHLILKTNNGKTQLEITSKRDIPAMLFRKANDYLIASTSSYSLIGSVFRKIDQYLGEDNSSLINIAKFLKAHEKEISKAKQNIKIIPKETLKQSFIDFENKNHIQFTFIEKLFGKRTGKHIHHQSKLHDIIDQSPIAKSDVSLDNLSKKTKAEIQQSIGKIFQHSILPIYKTPMPEIATCQVDKKDFIRKYIYNDARIIEHSTVRCWHDSMHGARVAFWTQVLIELYKKYGRDSIPNVILAGAGGGFHDTAREHEGTDHWDKESSLLFNYFLKKLDIPREEREIHVFPLREKDPQDGQFTTDEQRIVHDADCLDIIRVVRDSFKPDFLCFSKFEDGSFDRKEFIKEAADFIAYTEDPQLKYRFENESSDFYGDLIRLLFKLEEQQPGRFKIITSLIETPMAWYRESMDNSFITQVIVKKEEGK